MKPLTLYPHEIRRLLSTGSVTVWRPVNRRSCASVPTWLWNRLEWDDAKVPTGAMGTCADNGYLHIACRPVEGDSPDEWTRERIYPAHPPGSERWVKERFGWAVTPKGKSVIVYQADNQARPVLCDNEGEGDCVGVGKKPVEYVTVDGVLWKSAQRMPRWASRLSVTSTAVQARQVQSITEKEAVQTGVGPGFVENFEGSTTCVGYRPMFIRRWNERFDTLGPDPWAWATTLERKEG